MTRGTPWQRLRRLAGFPDTPRPDRVVVDDHAVKRKRSLRRELLAAVGQPGGLTAGLDDERVFVMPVTDRARLLLAHRLTVDLLSGHVESLFERLCSAAHVDVQLAVLRATVLSRTLAAQDEVAVRDDIPRTVRALLDLMPHVVADRAAYGYHAYVERVWWVSGIGRVPAVDLVVDLLLDLEPVATRGAALAAATVYQLHLIATRAGVDVLRKEQLALMTAFLGADAVSFQDGHLVIPAAQGSGRWSPG